ncbi:MAG: hybrid sensor histidine kinase/response regulator [Bacteroidota bacterium]
MKKKPHLLYIDDEKENLIGFKAVFSGEYDISITTSLDEAYNFLMEKTFEVVLVDYKMPDENGIEFVTRIHELIPDTVFIIISAFADLDITINAMNSTVFYSFIQKPWKPSETRIILKNAVDAYRMKTENKRLLQELVHKNNELESSVEKEKQANALKDIFLKNISHELRTPLNGIIGFNQLISHHTNDEKVKKYSEISIESSQRLLQLMDNIMHASMLITKNSKINTTSFNVCNELEDIILRFADKVNENVKLEFNGLKKKSMFLETDRSKFISTIEILLDNALKFTMRGSVIVDVERINNTGEVEISVSDSGIGIKKSQHSIIFEPFRQGNEGVNREYGGLGLGLFIAKKYVEQLGGSLNFTSTYTKGTTFKITLGDMVRKHTSVSSPVPADVENFE